MPHSTLPPAPLAQDHAQATPQAELKAPACKLHGAVVLALEAGSILLVIALFFDIATFAPSAALDAWVPLFVALLLTLLANIFLIYAWRHGGSIIRLLAAPTLLPTVYILSDIITRAPLFFR